MFSSILRLCYFIILDVKIFVSRVFPHPARPLCVKVFELAEKSLSSRVSFFWRNGNRIFLAVEIAVSCVSIVTESVKRDPISRKKIVETLNFARARIVRSACKTREIPQASRRFPDF